MQTTPKLLGFPVSPHVRAARIAFLEKQVSVEFQQIGLDHLSTDEYGRINPFRKMPALVIDGGALYEAPALMIYANAVGGGASLEPTDALERARMWQFIGVAQHYLYPVGVMKLYFHAVLAPLFGMQSDESALNASVAPTSTHLDVIESALASKYIAANSFTLADIYCGVMVDYIGRTHHGRALLASRPRVQRWLADLRTRASFESTLAAMLVGTDQA